MRIPLDWLKEYVDVDISPEDLADKLTMHGTEVVAIEFHGKGLEKVVVGKVKSKEQHPKETGFFVCNVDVGKELIQVLTDAAGIKVGDKVPIALEGGTVARDITIKKMELHGVQSFGMLCKPHHLGLPESPEIMKMPLDASVGKDVKKVIGLGGYVIDVDVLPNRGDCLSIRGVAREVSAILDQKLKNKKGIFKRYKKGDYPKVTVQVSDKTGCPRYCAKVIKNVMIGPSPEWLRNRLLLCGIRPINNVVDVTNYILLEMGQPMHAFDLDLIAGNKITVRLAHKGEKIKTIDGSDIKLDEKSMVIADKNQAVALAGVMGGQNSEVNEGTHTILLESAFFNPVSVYRTSRKMKIRTESSIRFEKGVDLEVVAEALERGAQLLAELAGGEVSPQKIDVLSQSLKKKTIELNLAQLTRVFGKDIGVTGVKKILVSLGFEFISGSERSGVLNFAVPFARARDIEREIDLIEEIIRIYGYERVPRSIPNTTFDGKQTNAFDEFIEKARDVLVSTGLFEIKTFSMISPKDFTKLDIPEGGLAREVPVLANPFTEDEALLRPTLLPGLLKVSEHNQNWQTAETAIFELDKIFKSDKGKESQEEVCAAVCLTALPLKSIWKKEDKQKIDFYTLKGMLENVLSTAQVSNFEIKPLVHQFLQPGTAAVCRVGKSEVGYLGKLHPDIQSNYGIKNPVYVFEINLSQLFKHANLAKKYVPLAKYPSVARDIAMIVSSETAYDLVKDVILGAAGKLVEEIKLFDFYTGKPVPEGYYSLALRVTYRDKQKTLSDTEVNKIHTKVLDKLKNLLKVEIRM
ncbi:MAG: phenylalanine--tRNA ligase subunit beta [Candidatus Margulisbacteria bacterium]|nr:phenylalanine--tRNA ligase subunit beta [Candidatus Margulisiibacteriota bacterium]MBU1021115.1 phenylalanine--tRNA ligase subunit beta [Candidatus Margulisiibacteriota bacterium]MBU1728670.1 phenylalanine--tRNA ligase subunit beta [Candidatus Margulisiibacteriota bacterium]MBU1955121.1 phenylalanine--tRNA ligase subunit beta [Candidatus Margulisiibacteriota bacterium]